MVRLPGGSPSSKVPSMSKLMRITASMTVKHRVRAPSLALAVALVAALLAWAGAEPSPADSHGRLGDSDDARQAERNLIEDLREPGRIGVLHPNPQSVLDGLQVGFVNVSQPAFLTTGRDDRRGFWPRARARDRKHSGDYG